MNEVNIIKVETNHWRIPSESKAFSGWLEGDATEAEREEQIAKTIAARKAWAPTAEAIKLCDELKGFIGCRVKIEFWDSCMVILNEGPSPLIADVNGVKLLEMEGFTQAYLEVSNLVAVPSDDLYCPLIYLQSHAGSDYQLAPLADLYVISKVSEERNAFA